MSNAGIDSFIQQIFIENFPQARQHTAGKL